MLIIKKQRYKEYSEIKNYLTLIFDSLEVINNDSK